MSQKTIPQLEKLLRAAAAAYYGGQDSSLSDAAFDRLRDELEARDPSNAFLSEVGAPADSDAKVKHSIPMGSLRKISPGDGPKEFATWLATVSKTATNLEMAIEWKLDGISIELVYDNGKFVQAITRGDGLEGEDVTNTIRNAQGVPSTIKTKARTSVRCEAVLFIAAWKKHFPDKANPRNTVSGLTRRTDAKGSEHITCIAFDVVVDNGIAFKKEKERITWLKHQGFEVTATEVVSADKVEETVKSIEAARDNLPFDIDGAVIKLNSIAEQEKLGEHNGLPYWARAWKFAAMGGHTTVIGVEWSVGTQGVITPVAKVAPVKVGGTTIRNVTLHNMDEIDRLGVMVGDEVEVIRAGDVIPKIVRVVSKGKKRAKIRIEACPSCYSKLQRVGPKLICKNASCEGSQLKRIQKWIKKRNIMFLGDSNLQTLWDAIAVRTITNLYGLTVDSMVAAGVSGGMATKIFAEIEKSRVVTLSDFIGSLSIDMLGRSEASNLVGHGIDTLDKWKTLTAAQIESFPGYQTTKATRIAEGVKDNWQLIDWLSAELAIDSVSTKPTSIRLAGKSFAICLTGTLSRSRREITSDIEAAGHCVVGSVNKNTTHLCQADPSSQSSKSKRAENLNIPVISESQLVAMLRIGT